jgi:mRNA-degrading endonuclease RelE of RelBE toxin-antitoxin system
VVCRIVFSTAAKRDYQNLRQIKGRIDGKLAQIAAEPLSSTHSKALIGQGGLRSARVGDWRILYLPGDGILNVTRIRHRREVYDNL